MMTIRTQASVAVAVALITEAIAAGQTSLAVAVFEAHAPADRERIAEQIPMFLALRRAASLKRRG